MLSQIPGAAEFRAMVVFAEHRYYGQSLPFGNASFTGANPGYLSVAQVLSDYTALITALQAEFSGGVKGGVPVIAFGGSYGGMLSAWWRLRYPWAVDGALAASAPILQFENITAANVFNHLTTLDYAEQAFPTASASTSASVNSKHDQQVQQQGHQSQLPNTCADAWASALATIQAMSATPSAFQPLSTAFALCEPLTSAANVTTLVNWITSGLVDMAMCDYPSPANFLEPIPAWPVNASCALFAQCLATGGGGDENNLVQCASAAIGVYYNGSGTTACNSILSDATADLGEQGWDYQSCTEMVMPIGQYGPPSDMFVPQPWTDAAWTQYCAAKWGVAPDFGWAAREFGGDTIGAGSRIIFSNGLLDPWRGGGVRASLSDSLIALTIAEGAHHLDLRAADPLRDPAYVRRAREQEKALVRQWAEEARARRAAGAGKDQQLN